MVEAEIPVTESAEEIMEYVEENSAEASFGDFADEYGDFTVANMLHVGPNSVVKEDSEDVYLSDIDVALGSLAVEEFEEHDLPKKRGLAGGALGIGAAGSAAAFLSSGDPIWLTNGILLGYGAKEPIEDFLREYSQKNEMKNECFNMIEEEFPG
jgi:hypothetical protein